MTRRLLLLLSALALLCSCGGGEPATTPEGLKKLRLQLNWFPEPEFGGMYAARERGFFAKHGLEVELLEGGAEVPAGQLVAGGRVELAVVAADQLLTLRAAGGRATAIFACFQKAPRVIVVKEGSPWRSLEQLWRSEATVMAADGLAFVQWLNRAHGGERLSFVPYAGSSAPLVAGSVDAMQGFATAEPVQLELDGQGVRSFLVADSGFDPYDVVVAANQDWLAKDPDAARAFVAALREGWTSYLEDPGPINAIMAERNRDMSREVMDASAAKLPTFVISVDTLELGIGAMTGERWGRTVKQLLELGLLEPPFDTTALFESFRDEPAPGAS
jgi:NitT/TauT family transport system substrate-binding protein